MNDEQLDRLYKSDRLNYIVSRMRLKQDTTPAMLAAELNVSERTIYRDLKNLEKGNTLKKRYSRREGRYILETEIMLPPISLTSSEALALHNAASNPALAEDNFYSEDLRSGLQKLTLALAPDASNARAAEPPEFLDGYAVVGSLETLTSPSIHRPTTEMIRRAMNSNRKLRFSYWYGSTGRAEETIVAPFDLRPAGNDWHLLAQAERGMEARIYKVSHMRRVEILTDSFRFPRHFSADDAFANALLRMDEKDSVLEVIARFSPSVAPLVFASQPQRLVELHEEADGSILCTLHANSRGEILWWLLAFGADAEVLGPEHLRDEFAHITHSMAALYETDIVPDLAAIGEIATEQHYT